MNKVDLLGRELLGSGPVMSGAALAKPDIGTESHSLEYKLLNVNQSGSSGVSGLAIRASGAYNKLVEAGFGKMDALSVVNDKYFRNILPASIITSKQNPPELSSSGCRKFIEKPEFQAKKCTCRLPWCPDCSFSYWAKVRGRLMPFYKSFKRVGLLTLTVDRKGFKNGYEAYQYGNDKIRTLLYLHGFKKAFKVLSFCNDRAKNNTYDEDNHNWPHWHIVVDWSEVAGKNGRYDYNKIRHHWRDLWKIGNIDVEVDRYKNSFRSAVGYCIKYCQGGSASIADWASSPDYKAPRAFEFMGSLRDMDIKYRSMYNLCEEKKEVVKKEKIEGRRVYRPISFRLKNCGKNTAFVFCRPESDGSVSRHYMGSVALSVSQIHHLVRFGHIQGAKLEKEHYISPTTEQVREVLSVPLDVLTYQNLGLDLSFLESKEKLKKDNSSGLSSGSVDDFSDNSDFNNDFKSFSIEEAREKFENFKDALRDASECVYGTMDIAVIDYEKTDCPFDYKELLDYEVPSE